MSPCFDSMYEGCAEENEAIYKPEDDPDSGDKDLPEQEIDAGDFQEFEDD